MKKTFVSESNTATMMKNFTFKKLFNISSMQNVHRSIFYVFENIEVSVFNNFQIMIIIQNTVQTNFSTHSISNYEAVFRSNSILNQHSISNIARKKSIITAFKFRKSTMRRKFIICKLFERKKFFIRKNILFQNYCLIIINIFQMLHCHKFVNYRN